MINIQIDDDIVLLEVEEDGRRFKKMTDLQSFRQTVGITETSYDSGLLPGRVGTKRIMENETEEKILYIEPAQRRTVSYVTHWNVEYEDTHGFTEDDYTQVGFERRENQTDAEYETYLINNWNDIVRALSRNSIRPQDSVYDIMLPNAVIIAKRTSQLQSWRIYLYTLGFNTLLTGEEELYEFPTPNIFDSGGRICWGNDEYDSRFDNKQVLQGLLPRFLSSPFNDDLAQGRLLRTDVRQFWRDMTNAFKEGKTEEEVLLMYEDKFKGIGRTVDYIWNE